METDLEKLESLLNEDLLNHPFADLVGAALVFMVFIILRRTVARALIGLARRLTLKTETDLDDQLLEALEPPIKFMFVVGGFAAAFHVLDLTVQLEAATDRIVRTLFIFTLFWGLHRAVPPLSIVLDRFINVFGRNLTEDLQYFFVRSLKTLVMILGGVAILQEWGINVAAFLGGLGLVGMAVALAAKDSVANIFGSLMIFLDRTFSKGDWIQTPCVEGVVEVIGLRVTKVRTFSKALVTVPNAELANSAVTNWSRMTNRRIKMTIGLEYRTTAKQLEAIVDKFREYLANHEDVAKKGPVAQMVHLVEFGPSSIDINLYYFTRTTNWERWREIRSQNILDFKKIVEEEGAAFAFPSSSVYIESMPDRTQEQLPPMS